MEANCGTNYWRRRDRHHSLDALKGTITEDHPDEWMITGLEANRSEVWEAEQEKLPGQQKLIVFQAQAAQITPSDHEALLLRAREATRHIDLDKAATPTLIDQELRDRGWEADTEKLRYAKGARPAVDLFR